MTKIHSLAIFCGSRTGNDPRCAEAARIVGAGLAGLGIRLVYGGGRIGMMGVVADAVLAAGGTAAGIIPRFLMEWEVAHPGLQEIEVTENMHTRKTRLYEEADAFLVLPGGLGTYDEAFEIITWKQLRLHDKPILVCDVAGWARPLAGLIDHAIDSGFTDAGHRALIEVVDGPAAVVERLRTLEPGTGGPASRL